MARDILGSFEYQILSVLLQPGDAYGTTILERIKEHTGREVSVGALYTSLDRLEKKGFVASWWGEPTAERGGRRKRYYRVQASGAEAVRRSEAMQRAFTVTAGNGLVPEEA
jgi:PadR family transcriptional regulator, regulatory protein PadR